MLELLLLNNDYSTITSDDVHLYFPTAEEGKDILIPSNTVLEFSKSIKSILCI